MLSGITEASHFQQLLHQVLLALVRSRHLGAMKQRRSGVAARR
jgi:hypothetical protein